MRKQKIHLWLIFYVAVTGLMSSMDAVSADRDEVIDMNAPVEAVVGELEFRECLVSSQGMDRKVQCAWYEVAENPQAQDGNKIRLFVARLPAKRHVKHINDPVLFIAGGPGQAASESYLFADHIWESLAKNRDFYLIDQRGTGYSNYMGCDDLLNNEQLVNMDYDSEKVKQLARDCVAMLPGDARFYTTDITVQDFDELRSALGIEKWNLLGVSYGTRVATHYMRSFPKSVRTVVLDSVVPPQHILGSEIAARSQQTLDVLFERCETNSQCHERMPELRKNVEALLSKLDDDPVSIRVENFKTGKIEDMTFTREHLVTLVRMYLYNPRTLALLPPMLHEAAQNGNYSPIARAATNTAENLQNSMATGLHNGVMCTEEYPYYENISEDEKDASRSSYMGMDLIQLMQDVCSVWPQGETIAAMKEPLISDIPTLLLSGEFDPITPPAYAEKTLQTLSNARHLVLKGQGHFVSGTGCTPHLVEKFVTDASSASLNTRCLDRISAAPLYLNFNGAAP